MDTEYIDDSEWAAIEQALQSAQPNNTAGDINNNYNNNSANNYNAGKINNVAPVPGMNRSSTTPTNNYTTSHNYNAPRPSYTNNNMAANNARINQSDPRQVPRSPISPANTTNGAKYTNTSPNNSGPISPGPRLISTSQLLGRSVTPQSPAVNNTPVNSVNSHNSPKSSVTINGNTPNAVNRTPVPVTPTQSYTPQRPVTNPSPLTLSTAPTNHVTPAINSNYSASNGTTNSTPTPSYTQRPVTTPSTPTNRVTLADINGNYTASNGAINNTPNTSSGPYNTSNPMNTPPKPLNGSLNVGPLPSGQYEFSLVSRDRFIVQHVIYKNFQRIPMAITQPNFVRLLQSLPTAKYDDESERWSYELSQHDHVFTALKQHHVNVTRLPEWIFKAFMNGAAKNNPTMVWTKLPNSLVNSLLPFQSEGIQFVVEKSGRALIGDEMGLGKTIQAIGVAAYYRDEWPLLIITPSSLRLQWAEQLERWLGDIPSTDINVVMTGKCDVLAPVNIISYDLVTRMAPKIDAVHFKVVICDESHFLKSYSAKRTKAVIPILQRAKRAVLLTGTPAVSRPVELFSQLSAIRTDLFPYFPPFGSRYCNGHKNQFQRWDYNGNSHLKELNCLLSESVMIRRLKQQVLTQLPAKLRQKVSINIPAKQQKMIKKISNELSEIRDGLQQTAKSRDAERLDKAKDLSFHKIRVIQELFRDTGTAKLPAVLEYITDLLEGDNKFLVFGHHQDVLDGIAHFMNTHRIDHIQIDGRTPGHARHELVMHFQNDPNCRVGVLSMTAAGTGLTLTAANTVIFAELFWNPGTLRQCEDRAHRIGQVSSVNVHYLVAAGTIDEMIWDLIDHKLEVLGEALNGQEDKLEVDENLSRDCNLDSITANSFIEYLLEKVDSYDERKTAMQKRQKIRERVKKMREMSDSSDDDLVTPVNDEPVKRVTPTGAKKRPMSDSTEDAEIQSPLKKSHVSLDKFVYRGQPRDSSPKKAIQKVTPQKPVIDVSSDDHVMSDSGDSDQPTAVEDDHVISMSDSDSSDSENELKKFKKTVLKKRLQKQRDAINSQAAVSDTPEKEIIAPNKDVTNDSTAEQSSSKSKLLKFAFKAADES